jgi:hypothetical protein
VARTELNAPAPSGMRSSAVASRKKVRPRISPRPYPIGTGYIRPCLQFSHCVTLIAAVNECQVAQCN